MIRRFRHRGLDRLFSKGDASGVDPQMVPKLRRMLLSLDSADGPSGMDMPGYKLHQLKGKRRGEWSVWVTGNWRLTFEFEAGHVTNVDLEDYH